ncbi:hypothetical protein OHB26_39450 (plasmid) [Nocardia sp. NBC_01503]|uniref:hypothetical protein n=1 Tax=Nocardia sp. NBC_01503 TaxID=2975997 RepID=UPI002E7BFC66|nr:hypothetical protein [Nocardia sp. NBC_01503]WTL36692.1 hypothetical protein OHB26_39125 [Nocardia sp. NBC_01503]WTL36755.1 hypothetical protein OHB26_39450 [Nocardia sp. NBC_01503]
MQDTEEVAKPRRVVIPPLEPPSPATLRAAEEIQKLAAQQDLEKALKATRWFGP